MNIRYENEKNRDYVYTYMTFSQFLNDIENRKLGDIAWVVERSRHKCGYWIETYRRFYTLDSNKLSWFESHKDREAYVQYDDSFTKLSLGELDYCEYDILATKEAFNNIYGMSGGLVYSGDIKRKQVLPKIKEVIFSPPATIVYWEDETRTVVKCQEGDIFNEEAGLAFCILKKMLGNKSNWNNHIRKITDGAKRYNYPEVTVPNFEEAITSATDSIKNLINSIFGIKNRKHDDLLSPKELVENNKDFDPENHIVVDINDELSGARRTDFFTIRKEEVQE